MQSGVHSGNRWKRLKVSLGAASPSLKRGVNERLAKK
jgi:hypothetical protein